MGRTLGGLATACAALTLVGCGGSYYFRWNARDFAEQGEGGALHARQDRAARTRSVTPVRSGAYVRVVVDQVCFPDEGDHALGTMFNQEAARMSFVLFATNEQRDIWRDVEAMTGANGEAEMQRQQEQLRKYRVFPQLHYTSRGTCVNRSIATDWLPVDDASNMPKIAFTAMVMHEEEYDRLSADTQRILGIAEGIESDVGVVTGRLRSALNTTGEVLSVLVPNRHVLWFTTDLEDLVITSAGRRGLVGDPVTVIFSEPLRSTDASTGGLQSARFTQSDVSDLLVNGQLRYAGNRLRARDSHYPEPYLRFRVEVQDNRSTVDFWRQMNRVLAQLSTEEGSSGDAARWLQELKQTHEAAIQTAGSATMTDASMSLLSRQHADYLRRWLGFAEAALDHRRPCQVVGQGFELLTRAAERRRWGAPEDLVEHVEQIVKDRERYADERQMAECAGDNALRRVCAAAQSLPLGGQPDDHSGPLLDNSPIDIGGTGGTRADRFYRVDVPADGRLWVTVRSQGLFHPAVALLDGCSASGRPLRARVVEAHGTRWATIEQRVEPGSYYVVVEDGNAEERGPRGFRIGADFVSDGTPAGDVTTLNVRTAADGIDGQAGWWRAGTLGDSLCNVNSSELRGNRTYVVDVAEEGDYVVSVNGDRFRGLVSLWSGEDRLQCIEVPNDTRIQRRLGRGQYMIAVAQRIPSQGFADDYKLVFRPGGGASEQRQQRPTAGACGGSRTLAMDEPARVELAAREGSIAPAQCGFDVGRGAEEVLTVDVPRRGRYVFAANGIGETDPVLYLRRSCQDPASELACNDDADGAALAAWDQALSSLGSAFVAELDAGRYALIVDTFGTAGGQVDVTWRPVRTDARPADACAGARELTMGQDQEVQLESRSGTMQPSACGLDEAGMGAEQVFTVRVPSAGQYLFAASGAGGADPVLYIRRSCRDAASQIACNDDAPDALRPRLPSDFPRYGAGFVAQLEAGTYALVVDTYGTSGGSVRVGWTSVGGGGAPIGGAASGGGGPPAGLCASVPALPAGTPREVVLPAGQSRTAPSECGLAAAGQGGDAAFSIRVDRPGDYVFTADGLGDGADPVLYLRRECANAASQIVCNDDAGDDVRGQVQGLSQYGAGFRARLGPGTYTLVVDSYGASGGGRMRVQWAPAR